MSVELELKIWTECLEMSCLIVEKKIEELVFGVVDFFRRQGKGTYFGVPQFCLSTLRDRWKIQIPKTRTHIINIKAKRNYRHIYRKKNNESTCLCFTYHSI